MIHADHHNHNHLTMSINESVELEIVIIFSKRIYQGFGNLHKQV